MTLHLINKTGNALELNKQVADIIQPGDTVLLIEDGVFQCLKSPSPVWYTADCQVYVLSEDADARGLTVPEHYTEVDYNDFVNLTIEHDKVVSWY